MWRRGYEVLVTGHLVVSADPRISVEKHGGVNTLVIKHITQHDAGDYVCQVCKKTETRFGKNSSFFSFFPALNTE